MYGNSNSMNCPDNKSSGESIKNASSNSLFQIKKLTIKNESKAIIGNLNRNSLPKKLEQLKELVLKYDDILVITKTKLDDKFLTSQFLFDGFS